MLCSAVLLTLLSFVNGCCKCDTVKAAAAHGGDTIDKEAELAELSLTSCKQADGAKCDEVSARLSKIRSTAADLKALKQ